MFSNRSEQLTFLGSVMVAIGAFAPMIAIGRLGTVSYADAADPEVYLLVAAALAASALIVAGKRKFTLVATAITWLILLWPMLKNLGGSSKDDGGLIGKISKTVTDPLTD